MVSSHIADALADPTTVLLELFDSNEDLDAFPSKVASHFAQVFGSPDALQEV
jgi:hypothetical protein